MSQLTKRQQIAVNRRLKSQRTNDSEENYHLANMAKEFSQAFDDWFYHRVLGRKPKHGTGSKLHRRMANARDLLRWAVHDFEDKHHC